MKVQVTILDPQGNKEIRTLDDENTGLISIGNARANVDNAGVLRLDSDEIDPLHAQLEFGRAISASPFGEHQASSRPVCHLIVFSDNQNIYRADLTVPVESYQFVPWYASDAFAFGPYTLLFDHEANMKAPFTVEV